MKSYSITDIGNKRKINQDYLYCQNDVVGNLPNLYIVADDMGGHNAGDYASRACIDSVIAFINEHVEDYVTPISMLREAIANANTSLISDAKENPELEGMGTTFVATTIYDDVMYVANVGDSRLYIVNNGIKQVTQDHSLVEEMVKKGELGRNEARFHPNKNIITRALGAVDKVEVDFFEIDYNKGDIVLLCSDGLSNMMDDLEILDIVKKHKENLSAAATELVEMANQYGGKDNISVIMVET